MSTWVTLLVFFGRTAKECRILGPDGVGEVISDEPLSKVLVKIITSKAIKKSGKGLFFSLLILLF